jgi:hypothetical protein
MTQLRIGGRSAGNKHDTMAVITGTRGEAGA